MEWETMSTPDLVNLANQLSHFLDKSPKRKTAKILNLQLQLIKTPNKTKIFLVSAITAKSQGVGKDVVTNLSTSGSFSPPASPSNVLPIPSDGDLRNYRGSF